MTEEVDLEKQRKAKKAEYQRRYREKKKQKELDSTNVENSTVENVENVENSTVENVENHASENVENLEETEIEVEYKPDGKPQFFCSVCGQKNDFCADTCVKCGENLDWRGVLDTEQFDDVPKFPCDECGLALDLDDPDLEEEKIYACPRCGWKFKFPKGFLDKYKR